MNLPDFSSARVLVVGDVMLDRYWNGPVSRISPEAPVPVCRVVSEDIRLGGAGNVALNVSSLGARSTLLGLVGDDDISNNIEQLLHTHKVLSKLQHVPKSRTITKLRIISRNQQLIRLDFDDDFPNWSKPDLESAFHTNLPDCDVVLLSDYAKGTLRSCSSLIDAARVAGKEVVVDPKSADFRRYKGATLITPNFSEFEAVVGHCDSESDIENRAVSLRDELMMDAILITRGERGMSLFARGHLALHLPTRAQEVFDVTGAGDTVIATLTSAIAAGASLQDAALFANVAAGVVVAKLGTASVSSTELQRQLYLASSDYRSHILDESELALIISSARRQGDRIVMTNGCFDILHPGHMDYLERAKKLGDVLIVAVNDDASVKLLKGCDRPVNTLQDRMRMLASLSCVDWIVPFSDNTPERLYTEYVPDVLVKGGDYTKSQVVGAAAVEESGGEVHIIDFVDGYSTTNLIKRIRTNSK